MSLVRCWSLIVIALIAEDAKELHATRPSRVSKRRRFYDAIRCRAGFAWRLQVMIRCHASHRRCHTVLFHLGMICNVGPVQLCQSSPLLVVFNSDDRQQFITHKRCPRGPSARRVLLALAVNGAFNHLIWWFNAVRDFCPP